MKAKIKLLKPPKSKTRAEISDVLISAIEDCRKEKAVAIGVVYVTEREVYTDYRITKDTSIARVIGGCDRLRHRLQGVWDMN